MYPPRAFTQLGEILFEVCLQPWLPKSAKEIEIILGKFTWGVKAKHCWVMSTNFLFSKACWQCFAFTHQGNFLAHNLKSHWRWRGWDRIQATSFKNLFYSRMILVQKVSKKDLQKCKTFYSLFINFATAYGQKIYCNFLSHFRHRNLIWFLF